MKHNILVKRKLIQQLIKDNESIANLTESINLSDKICSLEMHNVPGFHPSKEALDEICLKLDRYIRYQIQLLKMSMPRNIKGQNKNQYKIKVIKKKHLEESKFPALKEDLLNNQYSFSAQNQVQKSQI